MAGLNSASFVHHTRNILDWARDRPDSYLFRRDTQKNLMELVSQKESNAFTQAEILYAFYSDGIIFNSYQTSQLVYKNLVHPSMKSIGFE